MTDIVKWFGIVSTRHHNSTLIIKHYSGVFVILQRGQLRVEHRRREGAARRGGWVLEVGFREGAAPRKFLNFLNENDGVFWCTLEHCFEVSVPAKDGLAPDVHAPCLHILRKNMICDVRGPSPPKYDTYETDISGSAIMRHHTSRQFG